MNFYLNLTFDGRVEKKLYQAKIADLNIAACGSTLEDALMNLGIGLKESPEFWKAIWGITSNRRTKC